MENTANKKNARWAMFAMFLLGIVVGFLIAPIKRGMKICCDNKDSMNAYNGDSFGSEDYDCCDEDEEMPF